MSKEELDITPNEIDDIIVAWDKVRHQAKELVEQEKKYKRIITRLLDITNTDSIKGKELQVYRIHQKRRMLLKKNVPTDVYDKYSTSKEIEMIYIRPNNDKRRK